MTKKVFWEQPYLKSIETRITSVDGSKITVDKTIFFAFSGGQESDRGSIGGYPVIDAKKVGPKIVYTLPESHNLKEGEPVRIIIDWKRRYKLMRLHFAAELILELMYKKLKGAKKIGAHISEEKARIDFRWNESITPLLMEISSEAESIIQGDYKINSAYSDKITEKRFWEIDGFARVPCGGTHLKKTGEVGKLKLKRKNIGKDKERVEIYLKSVR
jgi:Ser-tRNA(Ala) deacylase AlaX